MTSTEEIFEKLKFYWTSFNILRVSYNIRNLWKQEICVHTVHNEKRKIPHPFFKKSQFITNPEYQF